MYQGIRPACRGPTFDRFYYEQRCAHASNACVPNVVLSKLELSLINSKTVFSSKYSVWKINNSAPLVHVFDHVSYKKFIVNTSVLGDFTSVSYLCDCL